MNPISEEKRIQDSTAKLPYERPFVTTFGSVAKLTMGTGTGRADGASGTFFNQGKNSLN
jgi:hypothetical protein